MRSSTVDMRPVPPAHRPDRLEVVEQPARVRDGVLFLNWRDLTHPEGGGSELYVETVAQRLAAAGEPVTVLCAAHGNAPRDEVKDGVRYVRRGGRRSVYLWAAALGVAGRLGRHGVVVDVHNGVPFLANLWSRRPVVVLVHHVHREQWPVVFGPRAARVGWWLESRVAPRVNRGCRYVAVSEVTRDELVELGLTRAQVAVVHNGSHPPLATEVSRTEHPSLVVLGRLVPHKRVELVLAAAAELRHRVPGLQVDVLGEGYWHERLTERVAELGLGDVVTLHGRVDEQTKADVLARSWLHVVPSLKEGWGLSVVEAGTHGTPSVAFRSAGGLAESIVDGVSGMLLDDLTALPGALEALLTDSTRRADLGLGAQRRAARFSWPLSAHAFDDVLQAVRSPREDRVTLTPDPDLRSSHSLPRSAP